MHCPFCLFPLIFHVSVKSFQQFGLFILVWKNLEYVSIVLNYIATLETFYVLLNLMTVRKNSKTLS